jgi:hypothetical protein
VDGVTDLDELPGLEVGGLLAQLAEVTRQRDELLSAIPDAGAVDEYWLRICKDMVTETAAAEHKRGFQVGYLAAIAEFKRAQHQAVNDLDTWLNRWHVCCRPCRLRGHHRDGCADCQARTRATFGEAHPDDFTALEAT